MNSFVGKLGYHLFFYYLWDTGLKEKRILGDKGMNEGGWEPRITDMYKRI